MFCIMASLSSFSLCPFFFSGEGKARRSSRGGNGQQLTVPQNPQCKAAISHSSLFTLSRAHTCKLILFLHSWPRAYCNVESVGGLPCKDQITNRSLSMTWGPWTQTERVTADKSKKKRGQSCLDGRHSAIYNIGRQAGSADDTAGAKGVLYFILRRVEDIAFLLILSKLKLQENGILSNSDCE